MIESLTAKVADVNQPSGDTGSYLLNSDVLGGGVQFMPVPLSLAEYAYQWREARKGNQSLTLEEFHPVHHSCLGEWYFATMKGSENITLGIDLINNLMSSQKIAERAFKGAAVPTVEEFYAMYGDSRALDLPERSDIKTLPTSTWNQFRDMFLKGAKSRTSVFDYRHCIRELHAVLEIVRTNRTGHTTNGTRDADLYEAISAAKRRIYDLGKQLVLGY